MKAGGLNGPQCEARHAIWSFDELTQRLTVDLLSPTARAVRCVSVPFVALIAGAGGFLLAQTHLPKSDPAPIVLAVVALALSTRVASILSTNKLIIDVSNATYEWRRTGCCFLSSVESDATPADLTVLTLESETSGLFRRRTVSVVLASESHGWVMELKSVKATGPSAQDDIAEALGVATRLSHALAVPEISQV